MTGETLEHFATETLMALIAGRRPSRAAEVTIDGEMATAKLTDTDGALICQATFDREDFSESELVRAFTVASQLGALGYLKSTLPADLAPQGRH